jgi:hypothetical protein
MVEASCLKDFKEAVPRNNIESFPKVELQDQSFLFPLLATLDQIKRIDEVICYTLLSYKTGLILVN